MARFFSPSLPSCVYPKWPFSPVAPRLLRLHYSPTLDHNSYPTRACQPHWQMPCWLFTTFILVYVFLAALSWSLVLPHFVAKCLFQPI
ncbi:unnamed protein product [Protopolystoma xenopodis]|uniref:Uncharacterized protein n=1 Tax=Protopolystoma xenopodis TaxID=117903 RepID=A0A3S5CTL4_9PLAT|nr:unnamed protein product [Protopolystoma xenopodis]